jgi:HAD superfamily hydrolase (TIGR01509 family)
MSGRPSVLLFDFGGTLDSDGVAWKDRFFRIWTDEVEPVGREAFDRAFYSADDELVGSVPKDLSLSATIERLGHGLTARLGADTAAADRASRRFAGETLAVLAGRGALLARLASTHRLAIVSNFYGNLLAACEEAGIRSHFSAAIDSADVGCVKPDPRIFQAALDALGARTEDAIFVGDSPGRDMAGARALGMQHILLRPNLEGDGFECCCPGDRVIARLEDLAEALSSSLGTQPGGILAAGEGSRLRRDGWSVPKPLVPVGGVTLIEHAVGNLLAAAADPIAILFNEEEQDCERFVREKFARSLSGRGIDVALRTTASSLETFRELSRRLPPGPALFSTVDAWCPREDFVRFATEARRFPDATVLAVTRFVDDERPLWIRRDGDGRVTAVGGTEGDAVTAGIYRFSRRARERALAAPAELDRLRAFLRWLVEDGEPVRAVEISKVIDVDRARDVVLAEELAAATR